MKIRLTFSSLFLLLFGTLQAQQLTNIPSSDFNILVTNTTHQMDYRTNDNYQSATYRSTIDPVLADSLQAALDRAVEMLDPIGLSVAVNLGDGDIWAAGAGVSSFLDSLDADHVFPIGSVSKTITSACIISMVDEGLLTLEDSIGTWISGYNNIAGNIKVYQLLNHTSGIYNYTNHPNWAPTINSTLGVTYTMEDMVGNFVNAPYFEPGTDWEYSNTNYLLLGLIIESISQKDYHVAVREQVLAPHGFDGIVLLPQEETTGPLAHVWQSNPPIDLQANGVPLTAIYSSASAAGAYAATPSDISEWIRKLYTGEILGDATDLLFEYEESLGGGNAYSLGVLTGPIDGENSLIGHDGAILYTSFDFYTPEKDVSFAIHTNDATKEVDLATAFFELYNECQEYNMTVNNEEIASSIGLKTFPNPTNNDLFVQFNIDKKQAVQVALFNTIGQQVYASQKVLANGEHQLTIEMSDLENGMYFMHLQTETGLTTKAILKQ